MFRQIRVNQRDRNLQRILWSPNSDEPPVEFRLNTVTYGTACAPFLAIRTLKQLAQDERARFPLGARCLEQNTYVDDTFAGAHDLSLAIRKREELVELLKSAGIELDKWAANHHDFLPEREGLNETDTLKYIDTVDSIKTLGVQWNPTRDEFIFSAERLDLQTEVPTKRSVLSTIARLFDPLGWLAPITVTAKILMQDLWIQKCDWDAPLPNEIREKWLEYCNSLVDVSNLSINRWLGTTDEFGCQIHGFSDASSRAYAAVVYLRIDDGRGCTHVSLLAARTKVAPVKTISIPNLELCGAVLLVKLICHLRKLTFLKDLPLFMWTDSQIVLTWLRKHPCYWRTFVANRVSLLQTELPSANWGYINTKQNPSDLATRGVLPSVLETNDLWWHGPAWLAQPSNCWPQLPETCRAIHVQTVETESEWLSRFSDLSHLIRVVAYCRRPLVKLRRSKGSLGTVNISLTASELSDARLTVIRLAQSYAFAKEISLLKAGKSLPKGSSLCKLHPFISQEEGILRVGGRLEHSNLSLARKHPPILPYRSALSRLFVRYAHKLALHGGPTLTSNVVSQCVWILGRNRLVKLVIRNCVTCQRVKPRLAHQLMGGLPAARVTPARPFTSVGLDYAGPIQVRTTKGRGHRAYKGYIALFICFSTRAIHLELVSDLTTVTFIAAYRRFVGRRGICRHLYSDNASTFQGADKELRAMFNAASNFYKTTAGTLANHGTDWTFIPPNAPHYGGLWEAGVKSTKHHLRRVIGNHALTFEELSTVLVEIEACLNSRPICPLSTDIDDLDVLTPAHFLIGETSALIPDEEAPNVSENRLSRFQLLQRIRDQFWKRWSSEYLHHLQERGK